MAEEPKASHERFVLKTSVPNSMIGQVCMAETVCSAAFVVWAPDVAKEHGSSQKRENRTIHKKVFWQYRQEYTVYLQI